MTLVKCTECGRIIETDELEEAPMDTIVGCGLKEGDFLPCDGCTAENDPAKCAILRKDIGVTKATLADLVNSI